MSTVEAKQNPIVVDRLGGEPGGKTTIRYEKWIDEVLWLRRPGDVWDAPNVFKLTGQPDADRIGTFGITLQPGEIFDVAVFASGQKPLDEQVVQTRALAFLKVFCLLKDPDVRILITDENRQTGGTWHWHQIHTNTETSIVRIGASRTPPVLDSHGIPLLLEPDGRPAEPLTFDVEHRVELNPLLPGNHYFLAVTVADLLGNWETRIEEFDTLRRQIIVEFPTIHIYNDGDPGGHGEGSFKFHVMHNSATHPDLIQEFDRPTADIDDWGETDRPYSVGFAHVGPPSVVHDGEEEVWVASWGTEYDGIGESDEGAANWGTRVPLPAGRGVENVPGAKFLMDCPTDTVDDDFHYGVEVQWSVQYVP